MNYFLTGGCGFLGSNLSSHLLKQGHELTLLDSLYREGASENLKWLQTQGKFRFHQEKVQSSQAVDAAIQECKPDVVFHLAGQVAMTTSISDPRLDFETNVVGGMNVLEAVRKFSPQSIVIYSSTNKVYGDLEDIPTIEDETRYRAKGYDQGFDEALRLDFRSPYGCSKGAIDQYMLDYSRIFDLKTVVFRHSSIFGGRQFSTVDQGWIGWFVKQAVETAKDPGRKPFTICGNGKQVRDVLFADDLIRCYLGAIAHIEQTKGQAYNIGGGIKNSLSLLELFGILEKELNVKLNFEKLPWRQSDQKVFVANTEKAFQHFKWKPEVDKFSGIKKMIEWVKENV